MGNQGSFSESRHLKIWAKPDLGWLLSELHIGVSKTPPEVKELEEVASGQGIRILSPQILPGSQFAVSLSLDPVHGEDLHRG